MAAIVSLRFTVHAIFMILSCGGFRGEGGGGGVCSEGLLYTVKTNM